MKKSWLEKLTITIGITMAGLFVIAGGASLLTPRKPVVAEKPVCSVDASKLLASINTERGKLGAPVLSVDPTLATSSRAKLEEMVSQSYFGHDRLDGSSWTTLVDQSKVHAPMSEDIEMGDLTAEGQWLAFKNSPSHYQSLTNPQYTRIGIASSCEDFTLQHATGPEDNSGQIGSHVTDMTVVHLAAAEPQISESATPTPTQSSKPLYYPSPYAETTHCTSTNGVDTYGMPAVHTTCY